MATDHWPEVRAIVSLQLGIDDLRLSKASSFAADDLDASATDVAEIGSAIAERLDVPIPAEERARWQSVKDILDFLETGRSSGVSRPAAPRAWKGRFNVREVDDVTIVDLDGAITDDTGSLREEVALAGAGSSGKVLVNLAGVTALGPQAARCLLDVSAELHGAGVSIKLANVPPEVRSAFPGGANDGGLPVYDSEAEALESF